MAIHYPFGGSTAERTLHCDFWQTGRKQAPYPLESAAATLGTALHEVLLDECMAHLDRDPYGYVGRVFNGITITRDHIVNKINPAIDDLDELMDKYDIGDFWVEITGEISALIGGTADFVGLSHDGETAVFADYKSGDGVMVFAEENAQGLFYAMCLLSKGSPIGELLKDVKNVIIAIVQPSDRRENSLDIWETDRARVEQFIAEHEAAVIRSEAENPQPTMGEHCKFCPAEMICPAKMEAVRASRNLAPDAESLVPALEIVEEVEAWTKAVRKRAHEALEAGHTVPGFKLVDKRASRVWNELEEVARIIRRKKKLLKRDCTVAKYKSPAQMEQVCKDVGVNFDDVFGSCVSAVSSGTTMVKATDSRPETLQAVGSGSVHQQLLNAQRSQPR